MGKWSDSAGRLTSGSACLSSSLDAKRRPNCEIYFYKKCDLLRRDINGRAKYEMVDVSLSSHVMYCYIAQPYLGPVNLRLVANEPEPAPSHVDAG